MKPAATRPNADMAAALATRLIGVAPASVHRFTIGARHYVFDVAFADRPSLVLRIGETSARGEIAGGLALSALLRPLGVPLPALLAADVEAPFPWMALERLPGVDLGDIIAALSKPQREAIAAAVARAEGIVAQTRSAGRYGYAATPENAPHESWCGVLVDNLARSEARMRFAGLFDPALVALLRGKLAALSDELAAVAATPFLHDATTKNVIVAPGGGFSGIVDVDDLCFGDPRYPAALTLASLKASGGPVEYVAAWLRAAGQRDDRLFQLYVALFLLDFMGEHGQTFNGNERASTPGTRAVLLRAFEERLGLIG